MKLLEMLRPGGPLTWGKACTCVLVNQLAAPGAGSLMGGWFLSGTIQLLASVTGFFLVVVWFIKLMGNYYSLSDFSNPTTTAPMSQNWLGFVGAGLFIFSWIWALVTSLLMLKQAWQFERAQPTPPALPPIAK